MDNDDKGIFQFPVSDVSEELIRTFVMREKGVIRPDDEIINGKYKFHNHRHQLSLISLEENDDDDEDDDDKDHKPKLELICDGCVTPIYQKKKKNSFSKSSSSLNSHKYYSCGECKYFLHWACFHLPDKLSSHPLHNDCNQKLILQSLPKLGLRRTRCRICDLRMNGLYYGCTECDFKADIKCTSLPDVIKHAGHDPQHHHYLKLVTESLSGIYGLCGACGYKIRSSSEKFYRCESCEFSLHCKCALLPPANKHRWDKHPLSLLIYGADTNHLAGELYCDYCEEKMNPKSWMYHCRDCDQSFHPHCFPTTSGKYRNIKFGSKYDIATCHTHPLIYQVITTKPRCDLCARNVCGKRGLQCASCNFVMCKYRCLRRHGDAVQAID